MPAMVLGGAGLVPPLIAIFVRLSAGIGSPLGRFAMIVGLAYVSLILSFLGGLWWGIVASKVAPSRLGPWLALAVVPSLFSLVAQVASGWYPGPAVVAIGVAIAATLLVDRNIAAQGLAPPWWMKLRAPLSLGLAVETLALSALL